MITNTSTFSTATSASLLLNKSLVVLISTGDLLVGVYLLILAVTNSWYGDRFCYMKIEWLVSRMCSILGVISTVGSQLSLYSMTSLSVIRVVDVSRTMTKNVGVSLYQKVLLVSICSVVVLFSIFIGVVSLIPYFESVFFNGIYYPNNSLFKGIITESTINAILRKYYGRTRKSWETISLKQRRQLIRDMFTAEYGGVQEIVLGFYGNDAVCLFKYFVGPNDPQRHFSRLILAINLACFVVIAISYVQLNFNVKKSSSALSRITPNAKMISRRNRKLQQKITAIIATDFVAWIPFITTSILHTFSVINATPWYALFSIVVLPVNCVINPLLYDKSVEALWERLWKRTVSGKTVK